MKLTYGTDLSFVCSISPLLASLEEIGIQVFKRSHASERVLLCEYSASVKIHVYLDRLCGVLKCQRTFIESEKLL